MGSPRTASGRAAIAGVVMLTMCGCAAGTADQSGFPNKTVEIVVGNAPGGSTDVNSRVVVGCLKTQLSETVVVKNVEGASGAKATREVLAARPDGHTLAINPFTYLTLSPHLDDLGFSVDDVTPVAEIWHSSQILVASAKSPYKSAADLFAAVKKQPGKVRIGTPGPTSPKSFMLQLLREQYGLRLEPVPFEGQSGNIRAVLGGDVQVATMEASDDLKSHIERGTMVALAALGPERVSWLPDTRTLTELGYPKATVPDNKFGLYGPSDLPAETVSTLESAVRSCLDDDDVKGKLGADYVSVPFQGSAATGKFLTESSRFFDGVVK